MSRQYVHGNARSMRAWPLIALGLAVSLPGMAVAFSPAEPATIEADRAEIDHPGGISRYFGNVELIQGDLRLTGDRLEVDAPEGELARVEATGEPARLEHRSTEGEPIRARARTVVYEPGLPRVTLRGSAVIEQGRDRFSAGRIVYAPDTGRLEADRNDDERVRMTIDPQSLEEEEDAPEADGGDDE